MAENILVGTCGYDYTEWRNVFYPPGLPREEFLMYYAARFNTVEINNTYYKMPDEYLMRNFIKKSGGKLTFSIKATLTLTHEVTADWKEQAARLKDALHPLQNDNLLTSVLFQFPQSFHYTAENRLYLDKLLREFTQQPAVVEFRHTDWLTERVYAGLEKRNTGICLCDMPSLKNLPGLIPIVTGKTAYIRYHGRNSQNWYGNKGVNGSERYRYNYTKKELLETLPLIKSLAARSKIVHIYFNNHPAGSAAVNALTMAEILHS